MCDGERGVWSGLSIFKAELRSFQAKGSVDKWWLGEENWLFNEQSGV